MLKTFLKNARQALSDKDNSYCISQCESALQVDSKSYNAYVFLAVAHTNLAAYDLGEKNYETAIRLDEKNLLAWQGLLNLYEKAGQISKYVDTSSRIAALHADLSENEKCLKTIEKAVSYAKEKGTSSEVAQALRLILPVSPFFRTLEPELPEASDTFQELAGILEEQETTAISVAIAKGRSRLGVKLDQLTSEVKRQIYSQSQLESVYEEIINWSHEEAVRRDAESKLLAHAIDRLKVAAAQDKPPQLSRVMNITNGMTIVKTQDRAAWHVVLDWSDAELERLDLDRLFTFITLFPENKFAKALDLYVHSQYSVFSEQDLARFQSNDSKQLKPPRPEVSVVLAALMDAYEAGSNDSLLLCHRILVSVYTQERDWAVVVDFAGTCAERIATLQLETGALLTTVSAENDLCMATALSYYRWPKFYSKAMGLFDGIVTVSTASLKRQALTGKARIMRLNGDYEPAQEILSSLLTESPDDDEATLEMAQCLAQRALYSEALQMLEHLTEPRDSPLAWETLAIVHYYVGTCKKSLDSSNREIYASFIQSLRFDTNFAPSYTALGLYYADIVRDVRRAEKCFQKALELSSAELVAAERLASTFADDGDWELVEIIAQRVIQGNERLKVSWPYRAIGFVHLNTGRYQMAVSGFQASLRIDSGDAHAWIGLGESYLELGRYQAAEKAFTRATLHDPYNWHARYLSSTVATALGEHKQACSILEGLISEKQAPESLESPLCVAYLAWAKHLMVSGWYSKAFSLLLKTLELAFAMLQNKSAKISVYDHIGKACKLLIGISNVDETAAQKVLAQLEDYIAKPECYEDVIPSDEGNHSLYARFALLAAKVYLHCIESLAAESGEDAVNWFELGEALLLVPSHNVEDKNEQYRRAAITAFQCAVKLDPSSDAFWSALGLAVNELDGSFAQHCLVKAISLNSKSSKHWANLGYVYLKIHHMEASNQAFMNAQTLDPSNALAWLGQASIAHDMGESDHELFEHALRLGNASDTPILAQKYIESALRHNKLPESCPDILASAIWALDQASKRPGDIGRETVSTYMKSLLLERAADDHSPLDYCMKLVETLEESYEQDESEQTLSRYCDAKAILARSQLRLGDYESAAETASSVIELEPSDNPQSLKSSRLVLGLSQYFLNSNEEAIATLQELYEDLDEDLDVLLYLIQILVSSGDETSNSLAFELLERHRSSGGPQLSRLYAAVIALSDAPSDTQKQLARSLLTELLECRDVEMKRDREIIERVLSSHGSGIAMAQVHLDPTVATAWMMSSQQDPKYREKFMEVATREALESGDVQQLIDLSQASSKLSDRLVASHLSPAHSS